MANFIDENTVFILDSYGLIFREYYAFFSRPLTDSRGNNVSALFGFFRNLSLLFKQFKPKYFVAAMDSRVPTFRHEGYEQYKANRAKTPEDLKAQFPMIEECLEVLGIPVARVDRYEADDVIATIARKCDKAGRHCVILSADKDLQQLANDNIHMLKPDKIQIWKEFTPADVEAEWGVEPAKILDLLALMGDTADNIPGVAGCGPKTAVKLINEYGSFKGIYQNADSIKGSIGEKIRSSKEAAEKSLWLATLNEEAPLDQWITKDGQLTADAFNISALNYSAFAAEMTKRELPALAKTYGALTKGSSETSSQTTAASSPEITPVPHHASFAPSAADEPVLQIVQNKGDYSACTDIGQLNSFIDSAIASGSAAFDTETDSLNTLKANLVGFSLSYQKGKGIYVPLILNLDPLFAPPLISKKEALDALKKLFASSAEVVMHNAKFDLEVLASNGLDILEDSQYKYTLCDTMIASWLLEPDRSGKNPYALETLSEQKLGLKGIEFGELVGKDQTFADVPLEKAAEYGAEDSDFTLQLWNLLKEKLDSSGLMDLYRNMEMAVLPVLARMELNGIHLDPEYLNEYAVILKAQLAESEKKIYATAGHEFNIASPKQLSTVLFEELKLKPGKKTKTGYSTDTDVLEGLRHDHPLPGMILDYRADAKLLSTYVETLPQLTDEHNRIHTTFMQSGTATGRLSSKDPNLQNIPVRSEQGRRIRQAFKAPQGKVLISADYAQIELVVLAHLSGDKNLCQAFNTGTDVHASTASIIYGIPMEKVTPEQRRNAKTLNFGLMYGMSAFRLASEINCSRTVAQEFITNYFINYSGVRDFFDRNVAQAQENGYIETIKGRRRFIPSINSSNHMEKEGAIRIAKNSPIQGSAADIVKQAMIDVSKALKETSSPARMLLQVHDELILECPDDPEIIQKTIALITDKMEHAVTLNVPLRVSVEHGYAWGEFH